LTFAAAHRHLVILNNFGIISDVSLHSSLVQVFPNPLSVVILVFILMAEKSASPVLCRYGGQHRWPDYWAERKVIWQNPL